MFNSLEKVESVVYSYKYLTIKIVILTGSKSSQGNKLSPLYSKTYDSSKYTNIRKLQTLNINASRFLVFSYFNKDYPSDSQEIYLSYPNLNQLRQFLKETINFLSTEDLLIESDGEYFYNAKYQDKYFKLEGLANDKSLILQPNIVTDTDGEEIIGCDFLLNSEEAYVSLPFYTIETIYEILRNLNLLEVGNQLLLMGMMYEIESKLNNNTTHSPSAPAQKPKKPFRKILKSNNTRKPTNEDDTENGVEGLENQEDDIVFEPIESDSIAYGVVDDVVSETIKSPFTSKKVTKTPPNKSKSKGKKKTSLNMDNISEVSKDIEDLFNDTETF